MVLIDRFLRTIVVPVFLLVFLLTRSAIASPAEPVVAPVQQSEGDVTLRNFAFRDGEHLALLKLHYTALGYA